jgi:guanosine-3',5'-bis(diphosphate) 3'-pyrophosphohydrolase
MEPLVEKAFAFAAQAHAGQKRKYTGDPYVTHCWAVYEIVRRVTPNLEVHCAALLHDTVEDTDTTFAHLRMAFGRTVENLVYWVTDVSRPEDGNRKVRKGLDKHHLAQAPKDAQTIKLADLIHNTQSILHHDPSFAKVYMREKKELLDVLTKGDPLLMRRALQIQKEYQDSL